MKYFLKEAHTPPNPNISPVPRAIILNIFEHIILNVLPAVFDYIKKLYNSNKSYKKTVLSDELIIKIINENVDAFRTQVQNGNNNVNLDQFMDYYLLPASIKRIEELKKLGLLATQKPVFIEYTFETNDANLCEDKSITNARGHTEYANYYLSILSVIGHIIINIQDLICLRFYNVYIKYGITNMLSDIIHDKKLCNEYLRTIRHEAQHAYQLYNSCIFNFYNYVMNNKKQGIVVTPDMLDDIFFDEISIDYNKNKNFTYFKKGPLGYMKSLDHDEINVKDTDLKEYYYDMAEAPVRLNDFIIGYVSVCKDYLNDADDIIDFLFSLLDLKSGSLFYKVIFTDEENIITKISENIYSIFEGVDEDIAYDFAYDLVENIDVAYNFPFIEDIYYKAEEKFKKYYMNKIKSKIQKELVRPSI